MLYRQVSTFYNKCSKINSDINRYNALFVMQRETQGMDNTEKEANDVVQVNKSRQQNSRKL